MINGLLLVSEPIMKNHFNQGLWKLGFGPCGQNLPAPSCRQLPQFLNVFRTFFVRFFSVFFWPRRVSENHVREPQTGLDPGRPLGPARIMPAFQQNERSEAKTGLDPDRPTGPARHVPVSQQNERPEAYTGLDPGRPLGPAGSCLPSSKTNVQRLRWAFIRAGHQGRPG